jgi:hypothetical protein
VNLSTQIIPHTFNFSVATSSLDKWCAIKTSRQVELLEKVLDRSTIFSSSSKYFRFLKIYRIYSWLCEFLSWNTYALLVYGSHYIWTSVTEIIIKIAKVFLFCFGMLGIKPGKCAVLVKHCCELYPYLLSNVLNCHFMYQMKRNKQ